MILVCCYQENAALRLSLKFFDLTYTQHTFIYSSNQLPEYIQK
jgi:hypothetical protein